MTQRQRITIEEIIELIGDDIGTKYTWFLVGFSAQGIINESLSIEDIRDQINLEDLGYYEVTWDFVKLLAEKLGAVVEFHLIGCKSKNEFLKERSIVYNWDNFLCELNFDIYDGEIWTISGRDSFLIEKLKKIFSPLPIFLM